MRSVMLTAAVGLLCVTAGGCDTIVRAGNGIETVIYRGGGDSSASTAPKETTAPKDTTAPKETTATKETKAPKASRSAPAPKTTASSGKSDRGCVQAIERVSLGTSGSWESGELCIAPHSLYSHQVKLTLTGNGSYSCHAAICTLDVAFGQHAFQTLLVLDGGAEGGPGGGTPGVVYITNRERIEKAMAKDPVMSIRIPFDGGRWGILKFDTRGFRPG